FLCGCVFYLVNYLLRVFSLTFLGPFEPEPNNTDRLGADFRKPKTSARPAERNHRHKIPLTEFYEVRPRQSARPDAANHRQKVPLSEFYVGRRRGVCIQGGWSDGDLKQGCTHTMICERGLTRDRS